jgi:hypothetical protein
MLENMSVITMRNHILHLGGLIDLQEMVFEDMEWIQLALDRDQWRLLWTQYELLGPVTDVKFIF